MTPIDGYRRLAIDSHSRLGWRIITLCFEFPEREELVRTALEADDDLVSELPDEYRDRTPGDRRARPAPPRGRATHGGERNGSFRGPLAWRWRTSGRAWPSPMTRSRREGDDEDADAEEDAPTIRFTSLVGSKGLSASYVFIVGFNNGFFPRNPNEITDDEVCKLLVALSRTRVECHVVSCRRFGAGWLRRAPSPSGFARTSSRSQSTRSTSPIARRWYCAASGGRIGHLVWPGIVGETLPAVRGRFDL